MTAPDSTQDGANPALAAGMTVAYLSAVKMLRDRLSSTVASLFDSGSYRDVDANAYVELMGPVSVASQQTMANITAAYLAHQVQMMTGTAVPAPDVPADLISGVGLRGVDPATVLRRPYEQVWYALSQGKTLEQAAAIGRKRALDNALTDLQLARTRTAQRVLGQNHLVTGYRRVLTGPHSCALCVVASTHTYKRADLMPIHPQCDCAIEPLIAGQTVPETPLEQVHAAIRRDLGDNYVSPDARRGIDYRKVLVTHEHGEIGPVLAVRGQHFTGPSQIPGEQ
jgi:hypothetical protein